MQIFLTCKKCISSVFILLFILSSTIFAASSTSNSDKSFVDNMHKKISYKVIEWSDAMDNTISSWLGYDETNNTICNVEKPDALCDPEPASKIEEIDAFFQNERYLNESRDIYVRLRLRNEWNSRESNKIKVRVSARLPFNKCKKQWNIFFEETGTNNGEIKKTDTTDGGVGINYYKEEKFGIKGNYAIGLNGISPYFRVRYGLPMKYNLWEIEPTQTFKYSIKNYFSEESNIYFDRFIDKNNLFRIQLHRGTASTLKGTDYGLIFHYFWNLEKNAKVEFTQAFYGNTYYNDYYKEDKTYHGINNYVSSVSWRQSIWRDWFYYEIKPSVNFHKDYDYKASYRIRFNLDFYFGNFIK